MDGPKRLIVCKSTHHGNTWKIGEAMAEVLEANLLPPEDVDPAALGDFEIVGFGSGIYFGRLHPSIEQLASAVGGSKSAPERAVVFSTSGLPFLSRLWHRRLRRQLERAGSEIVGEFSCRGWDTVGPLALVGGLNRGHPDQRDLERAREFARVIARCPPTLRLQRAIGALASTTCHLQ